MGGLANRECPLLRQLIENLGGRLIEMLLEQCNEQTEEIRQRGLIIDSEGIRYRDPKPEPTEGE